jgi:hypothetical protein
MTLAEGCTQDFFYRGAVRPYMPKKVPNIQRIINNDILKIVNIVFSGGGALPPLPPPERALALQEKIIFFLGAQP